MNVENLPSSPRLSIIFTRSARPAGLLLDRRLAPPKADFYGFRPRLSAAPSQSSDACPNTFCSAANRPRANTSARVSIFFVRRSLFRGLCESCQPLQKETQAVPSFSDPTADKPYGVTINSASSRNADRTRARLSLPRTAPRRRLLAVRWDRKARSTSAPPTIFSPCRPRQVTSWKPTACCAIRQQVQKADRYARALAESTFPSNCA
jgi:hypothetical protein